MNKITFSIKQPDILDHIAEEVADTPEEVKVIQDWLSEYFFTYDEYLDISIDPQTGRGEVVPKKPAKPLSI